MSAPRGHLPFPTPPTSSSNLRHNHKRTYSSSAVPTSAGSPNLNFSISANGKASIEQNWDSRRITPHRPVGGTSRPRSTSLAASATFSTGRARQVGWGGLSLDPFTSGYPTPPSAESTPPSESIAALSPDVLSSAAVPSGSNPILFDVLRDGLTEVQGEITSTIAEEPGSPDIGKQLLATYTFASPSPVREKRLRRSKSLAELGGAASGAPPLSNSAAINSMQSGPLPYPGINSLKKISRNLSTNLGPPSTRPTFRTRSRPPSIPISSVATPGLIRTSGLPTPTSSTTSLFPSVGRTPPGPDPAVLLPSLEKLLKSSHLLPSGWMQTLDLLVEEGVNALEGHTRGPSQIAKLLQSGKEAEEAGRLQKAGEKSAPARKRHKVSNGEGGGAVPSVRFPAVEHPPYPPGMRLTWIQETGLGDCFEEED
ncbi:hypothetical protein P7C70_g1785, partial [Phenoliferia sp. Uapishka_3]